MTTLAAHRRVVRFDHRGHGRSPIPPGPYAIEQLGRDVLGREHELAMHVRAALRNGLTPGEISEVLLHTAVYAGVPAVNAGYAIAQRALEEDGVPPAAPTDG